MVLVSRRPGAGAGQEALPFVSPSRAPGRMELATRAVLEKARADDQLDDIDEALAQLAVEASRAIDQAGESRDPYAFSQPAAQLRDTLVMLGLDPKSRGASGRDPFDEFLEDLDDDGRPAGQVRHSPKP